MPNVGEINVREHRTPDHDVDELLLNRWSPRAMSGEAIEESELMRLFEAARWAPSSYNGQPWRFLYARRDTPAWNTFFDLMVEFNQGWTKDAAVLLVMLSANTYEHNGAPNGTHSFDAGAAWQNLALQGTRMGLVVHGMSGFDYDQARKTLNVPEDYTVEAMVAIGKPGRVEDLPEGMREKEAPNGRKPVSDFVREGVFSF